MTRREKTIVYGSLSFLILCNVMVLLGSSGRAAVAEIASTLTALGPAKSITLVDEDAQDEAEIVLRNDEGRIGWSENDFARAHSVAYVHIGDILNTLMESGTYKEEREILKEELARRDEELTQQWKDFQEQYGNIQNPDDPKAEEARQAYQKLQQQMQQWQQERQRRQSKLTAEQLERAYRELVGAVKTVANDHSIDVVYRFIPTDDPFETERAEQAMENIRLRPVLKYPEALDITPEVKDALAL